MVITTESSNRHTKSTLTLSNKMHLMKAPLHHTLTKCPQPINVITSRSPLKICSQSISIASFLYFFFRFTATPNDVNSIQAPKMMNNSCANLTTFVKYHFNCEKQCHFNFAFSTFSESVFIFCFACVHISSLDTRFICSSCFTPGGSLS